MIKFKDIWDAFLSLFFNYKKEMLDFCDYCAYNKDEGCDNKDCKENR